VRKRKKRKSFRLKMKRRRQKRNTKGILKILKKGNKNV
jgi:hypothetical protein|tara:strand:- start:1028 stop:1141 length:114 start_codon:yes stop_codon:yes gene_type:complete